MTIGRREFFSLGFLRKKREAEAGRRSSKAAAPPAEDAAVPTRASFSLEELYAHRERTGAAFEPMPTIAIHVLPEDYDVDND